jgi:glyoxylase-like metal-dependent hydrolase (beta-lactamase superfamily II)
MAAFEQITSEIFQVGGGYPTAPGDAAIYLIHFEGRAALVDAGCEQANHVLFENIGACCVNPKQIEYLLITHCHFDHTGGAKFVREAVGCTTVAHELDAVYLEHGDNAVTAATWYGAEIQPFPVDRRLAGPEEAVTLGNRIIKAIHTPGHSPGSVVYMTESDGLRVVFAQDVHGPLDENLKSNSDD